MLLGTESLCKGLPLTQEEFPLIQELHEFVGRHPRLLVLSGAGISTASGIPGYRDEDGVWKGRRPTMLQEFLGLQLARQRYWARSMIGWPEVANAQPNAAHYALARLEAAGHVQRLVTQNVDGLHQRAGSTGVIELHGSLGKVVCLTCGRVFLRSEIQHRLESENPLFAGGVAVQAPDGDALVEYENFDAFHVPQCSYCGGLLKPDVVFFGGSVPRDRIHAATQEMENADALLVVGSSLMVYSGYRFCLLAHQLGKPIAAINLGHTRADALLALKVRQPCIQAFASLLDRLGLERAYG
ncbi:MAG: NAD-dependent protein deacetylase [Burkholderiaceae bacterium]|nr:MAG: NAD-dependent protein deacetylase [Burkholderiaceae bacterium]TAM00871.1 MAG: NAD-dependent protein deacetylase [Pusillimonas sp.]